MITYKGIPNTVYGSILLKYKDTNVVEGYNTYEKPNGELINLKWSDFERMNEVEAETGRYGSRIVLPNGFQDISKSLLYVVGITV